ncbi:MAG: hypothetical protein J7559_02205 [Cohnella sp.]|nr:hypothetical protein [Cohnella sp.]
MIGNDVDFLPLRHPEQELFVVKVNRLQDFIDMTRPVECKIGYGYFSEYMHIHPEKIEPSAHIFRLPQRSHTRIYVSDEFKNQIEAQKLKTFHFVKLWDTEYTEESRNERLRRFDSYYPYMASRESISFHDALVLLREGKIARHKNKIVKKDSDSDKLLIGEIFEDETVQWIYPTYIPPLFLDQVWFIYGADELNQPIYEYMAELSYELNGHKEPAVTFADKSLEQMVRRDIQIYKEDLTETNLLKLRWVIPKHDDGIVAKLRGIEHAINLVSILIKGNTEFDPNELKHLPENLQSLSVDHCGLTDLDIMKDLFLPRLCDAGFNHNHIVDLSPLVPYQTLTRIDVENNRIESIRCLNALTGLSTLAIRNNPIMNIHELRLPKLKLLDIRGVESEDWSFLLESFPSLTYLLVSEEKMTNASKKSMKDVIRSKKFAVSWTGLDGMSKEYNKMKRS